MKPRGRPSCPRQRERIRTLAARLATATPAGSLSMPDDEPLICVGRQRMGREEGGAGSEERANTRGGKSEERKGKDQTILIYRVPPSSSNEQRGLPRRLAHLEYGSEGRRRGRQG